MEDTQHKSMEIMREITPKDSLYTKDDKETGNTWGTCQT